MAICISTLSGKKIVEEVPFVAEKKTNIQLFRPLDLTQGSCWKTILIFSLPVILSYLLQQVYSISDAAIVGQTLTAQEVAGVNDTNALVFIFLGTVSGSDFVWEVTDMFNNFIVLPNVIALFALTGMVVASLNEMKKNKLKV